MSTRSAIRVGALCGMFAGAACFAGPAAAQYLINPGLDAVGPDGSPVTTTAPAVVPPYAGGPSAALAGASSSCGLAARSTTTLLPTTRSVWQRRYASHRDGQRRLSAGGAGQRLGPRVYRRRAAAARDRDVRSLCRVGRDVRRAAWRRTAPFSRIRRTLARQADGSRSPITCCPACCQGLCAFETLTYGTTTGGDYYVDNINVTGISVVPEPATMTLLAGGLGGLFLRRRRAAQGRCG